jgi:hypothetical protein
MSLPDGNFDPKKGDRTELKHLERNEFGYTDPEFIIIDRERAYLSGNTPIMRSAQSKAALRVGLQRHGIVIEFLGGLLRDSWSSRRYAPNDMRVAQIICGGKSYARWGRRQFYVSLRTMEVGEGGFIQRGRIRPGRGAHLVESRTPVRKHGRPGCVRVRCMKDRYGTFIEREESPGIWVFLIREE